MSAARNILLMTSTIAPKAGTFALKRADPADRLGDYVAALDFYAGELKRGVFDALVYVDNSGHPLDALRDVVDRLGVADRVEFVSYASDLPSEFSRYYLEAHLLVEAMNRSTLLREAGDATIWKVTGRYIVENVADIVRSQPASFDLYLNLRNSPERVVDFFLAAFRRDAFWKTIGRDLEEYRTTEAGEKILRRKIDEGSFDGVTIVPRLARTPKVLGVRGFDGASYGGFRHQMKFYVRAAANRALPWLWI
ncbi:MAG: hypothetical protein VX640_05900 [Pseudomonadota bacterium]|nr:hypothetical protein [Pseudomonadota bacterium]